MPNIGGMEMAVSLIVVLLLFGARRIPETARALGSGIREFKRGASEGLDEPRKAEPDGEPS
ncbi:MAG TPA: twin-arginine translocase TatA/TatE family subunit [Rubrobacter sp.]|nr:twin-arginine translocase TatA/TatE family subunit [Rubrobacter sp.]